MARPDLTRDQIVQLLGEVGDYLHDRGQRGELFVVGGAAMALAFDARRLTGDVDAVFEPTTIIRTAAQHVAQLHPDLIADDWLNDAVKGLIPSGQIDTHRVILDEPGIRVSVPAPDYLLATKIYAARADRDIDDIKFLADLLGITSTDELLELATRFYPRNQLQPKSSFLIQQIFGPRTMD